MTIREIRSEMEKIYKERGAWDGGKGPFTREVIRRRELVLMKQQFLYRLEEAKLQNNKAFESFCLDMLKTINKYLKEL